MFLNVNMKTVYVLNAVITKILKKKDQLDQAKNAHKLIIKVSFSLQAKRRKT